MTKFEIVIPTEWGKDVFNKVIAIAEKKSKSYAWALHPIDELSSFEHWHIGVELGTSYALDDLVKWYADIPKIQNNSIQGIKSHWKTYVVYILHKTEKAVQEGKTIPKEYGGNVDFNAILEDYNKRGRLLHLIDEILSGALKEYQFYNDISLVREVINANMMSKVTSAFKAYNDHKSIGANRGMERKQFWIFGKSGCGKTELAKYTCKGFGYTDEDIYITSSGSNPLDDYKGQPCIVVDDIDGQTMTPKTALKLIDIFTNSAIGARYYNKRIEAVVIAFTSTISPTTWWSKCANEKVDGNVYQLLRRLNKGVWHIEDASIETSLYDGQGNYLQSVKFSLPQEIVEKVQSNKVVDTIAELQVLFSNSQGEQIKFNVTDIEMSGFKPIEASETPFNDGEGK